MSDSAKTPQLHPANELIAKLYSTVVDNKNMPELFSAWDEFAEHVFADNPEEAALWQPVLGEHFEQAGPLVVVNKPSLAEEKQAFVDRQSFPAILFNSCFRLVAKNQQADSIWPKDLDSDISTAALPPFDPERVLALQSSPLEHPDPVLVSLDIGLDGQAKVVMAVVHPVEFTTGDGTSTEPLFVLRIAKPRWYVELGRMLSNTYGLTESEIEVARALYQNKTLQSIAEERQRSIRTVRTQLSQVFEKTGASSQPELISMISNLGQILELGQNTPQNADKPSRSGASTSDVEVLNCHSPQGHSLSYATFGDSCGKPVLSIQPTIPPKMTARFRQAVKAAGLRFIVPFKPGSGQSSSRNYSYTPEHAVQDYQAILQAEKVSEATVLGVYSGGVFALEFAQAYPDSVSKLVMADTGVPLKPPGDFMRMSASARRTFLPARFFPRVLLTPHKLVAKDFHESHAGQRRVVEYFFNGNAADLQRVTRCDEFYNITRDMIRYSFEDINQLVDTVCLWASDWQKSLDNVALTHSIHFIHGIDNDVFKWTAVEAFAQRKLGVTAAAINDNGQLGIFVKPEQLMPLLIE